MKKILTVLLVISVGSLLWCDLQEHYKKGVIHLKEVKGYGEGNDWEELFYSPYKEIVATNDGAMFVVNSRKHNIYKFDKKGKLVKTFGKRGKGPGDHVHPGDPSILDKKYLVTGEYATNRRFSLWHLDGRHYKLVKTNSSVYYLTALRDNMVAYYSPKQFAMKKNGYKNRYAVILKNVETGKETILETITFRDRSTIEYGDGGAGSIGDFFAEVYLNRTCDGNLAVGLSNQSRIDIYSPTGKKLRSFDLKMSPIPSGRFMKSFKERFLKRLYGKDESKMNRTQKYWHNAQKRTFGNFDFSIIFDKYLPLYYEIMVDSEGNFLVFKFNDCLQDCPIIFQVYSKDGTYLCETRLDPGQYQVGVDRRFRRLCFTSDGIYAYIMDRGDEDEIYRLIKSNY
jgi:hypothetical protein